MDAGMKRAVKAAGMCLFLVYLAGLIYFLFFAESYGRGSADAVYDCNLVPLREIRRYLTYWETLGLRRVFLNLGGNILGFLPFGALVPLLLRSARSAWKVGFLSLEISILIEVSQLLFQVGCCDVDDVILNTLGGLLGYAVFKLACGLYCSVRRSASVRRTCVE